MEGEQKLERITGGHPLSSEEKHCRLLVEALGYYRLSMGYGINLATVTEIMNKLELLNTMGRSNKMERLHKTDPTNTPDGLHKNEENDRFDIHDLILNFSPAFEK